MKVVPPVVFTGMDAAGTVLLITDDITGGVPPGSRAEPSAAFAGALTLAGADAELSIFAETGISADDTARDSVPEAADPEAAG